ncbi:DUF6082 family protein [Streptosporangium sp. NPDC049248]|uniref:DUF6082 family protein n=1 Tax=Streptosporangium sp. NPDC049248 TaxID=3155651 RepID=UPI00342B9C67
MRGRRLLNTMSDGGRRFLTITLLLVTVLAVPGFVVLSPLFLTLLNDQVTDWGRLSDIGQTYGAASAVLAVFALMGVTVSLILQARESKANREQTLRALHGDLMRMAMEDPLYRASWGAFFTSEDTDAQRAHMYVNMIVNHWLMMWELRSITEAHLRAVSSVVLSGPIGWKFWTDVRERRTLSAGTRRERRFNRILDEVYRTAPAPPRGALRSSSQSPPTGASMMKHLTHPVGRIFLLLGLLAVVASAVRRLTRSRPSPRSLTG